MIVALLRQAREKGIINWDKIIQKVLFIVLIFAFLCRIGDITKTLGKTHNFPFLCYNDFTIKLIKGIRLENLEASVVIRNEKGKK